MGGEMADVEALMARVQRILLDNDLKLELTKFGLMVPFESTVVRIVCGEFGENNMVVSVRGQVAQHVPISTELKEYIATISGAYMFGHPAYFEDKGEAFIEFKHNLLGDFLDPDELLVALALVAQASNDLDDEIKGRFGGERWIDPHTEG
jgi:hypothetical protein